MQIDGPTDVITFQHGEIFIRSKPRNGIETHRLAGK